MIFYVGSFIYALIDALKNLGDNDTSHAIALGIWYSVFVIVAIVCGVSQLIPQLPFHHWLTLYTVPTRLQ